MPFETASARRKGHMSDLVRELGVDGDYARFWPFVSGLLSGEECELLLSALAANIQDAWQRKSTQQRKTTQHLLLLLQCHVECASKLPREGSPSVAALLKSTGLLLRKTHLSFNDTVATAEILRIYGTLLTDFSLHDSSLDHSGSAILLAGLQECTQLECLDIGAMSNLIGASSGLHRVS